MSSTEFDDSIRDKDIAVIGMSGRFPDAPNLDIFWRNLQQGHESVKFFSEEELLVAGVSQEDLNHPNYVKAGVPMEGVELFDAPFFGYTPREADLMDPQQRLFLEHSWEALEDAGYVPHTYNGLIGVYAGVAWNTYLLSNLVSRPDLFGAANVFQVFITNDKDFMPTRVSYKLNLKGPSVIVQTSCSTSLVAVHLACLALQAYECDIALAGGVTVKVPQKSGYMYQEAGLASPDGHCRSFDARGQGTIFGNGIGVVVLKRLADAVADGDTIHAVVKGSAINNDGSLKVSYTAPSVDGQAEVIAAAQATAEVEPETISYIEAHGTGTALGDPIEVTALTKVFAASTAKKRFCAIGSVKSNLGHLDAAAGIAGFIKTVLALKHRQIPPSLHFESPNPKIDFANSPFYVNAQLADWTADTGPLRAGVSSFGVGGTNAHVILEEAPELLASASTQPWHVLILSARSATALEATTTHLAAYLRQHPNANLADVAYTLQVGRTVFRHRRIVVSRDCDDALDALNLLPAQQVFTYVDEHDPRDRPVVFMFPGQGAQYVQMARELYQDEPCFREHVDRCAVLLRSHLGLDLREVLYPEDTVIGDWRLGTGNGTPITKPQLDQTQYAQPALFVIEYALAQLWLSWGVQPQAMIGHSVGEYVAACLAGVFSLEDALALVATRGQLMQSLPGGAMLGVHLSEAELLPLLTRNLALAAVNAPDRCVAAGTHEAIAALEERLAAGEIPYQRLHTSHAFHSPMMTPILDTFTATVAKVRMQPPRIPYLSNVTGTWITADEATSPHYWANHLRQPVRFAVGLAELASDPTRIALEVGPGTSLSTIARQQQRPISVALHSLRHPQRQDPDKASMLAALGRLWLAGVTVDWSMLHASERRRRVRLPTYPFERQRYWIERAVAGATSPVLRRSGLEKQLDPADWFYLPSWKRSLPLSLLDGAALRQQHGIWLIFVDRCGVAAALVEHLTHIEQTVITVEPGEQFRQVADCAYVIDPHSLGDYVRLLDELHSREYVPGTIAHLWSITTVQQAELTIARFQMAQSYGFDSLLLLVQALGEQQWTKPLHLGVVTNNMQNVASEAVLHPEKATTAGLCSVIPQEYPYLICRSIDVVLPDSGAIPADKLSRQLIAEITADTSDNVIAYRDNQRWVETFEPVRLERDGSTGLLHHNGVYLITGGLSSIGAALAESISQWGQARLALVEDVDLPARDQWSAWLTTHDAADCVSQMIRQAQSLEQQGATILVISADIADSVQLSAALSRTYDYFGALHGVIHAAGVQGEQSFRSIQETNPVEAAWHFSLKAHGALALAEALAGRQLEVCYVVSSLSSVLGGRGYAAYTAANRFMDEFVRYHNRRSTTPWISVNWDAWHLAEGIQLTTMNVDLAQLALESQQIGEVLLRSSRAHGLDQIIVSTADLVARIDQWKQRIAVLRQQSQLDQDGTTPVLHARPPLQTAYVAPASEREHQIGAIWQKVLGFDQIGVHDNFFELGGDSLIAIRVVAQIKAALGVDLPVVKLYQSLTIRSLATLIEQRAGQTSQQSVARLEERQEQMTRRRQYQQMRRSRKE